MTTSKPTKRAPKRSGHATVVAADAASNIVGGPPGAGPTSPKGALALESPGSRAGSALEERPATALADPNSKVALLAQVPAEEVWLASLRSERTRKAYRQDVSDFVGALDIASREELYAVTPAAVLAWQALLEARAMKPTTLRRKLSALSSLFRHLVKEQLVSHNPVRDITRPRVNRRTGKTAAFSQEQARAILDAPPSDSEAGLRDRALLSVGLQVGARRAEIANMTVGDVHQHRGMVCLRYARKGGEEHRVPLNPQTEVRIREYLERAGHANDPEAPLLRPLRGNQVTDDPGRHMTPDLVDKVLRKWVSRVLGFTRGFSAHSMRATFITRALENGCSLERVQKDVGHAHPSTTQLYDHREDDPEKSATFFATY